MCLQKCLFSFVVYSSGGNTAMTHNSGKTNYPSCSVVHMVWDSCRLRTVKFVKPKTAVMARRQKGHRHGKVGLEAMMVGLPAHIPAQHPARVWECPSPTAQPAPRMCGGKLSLLAGRRLWCEDGGHLAPWRTAGSRAWPSLAVLPDLLTLALMISVVQAFPL